MARRATRIHPPKIPKGERAKVTIANQEKQIKLLIDRCEKLNGMLDHSNGRIDDLSGQNGILNGLLEEQREQYTELSDAFSRLSGWQDCIREFIAGGTNPFTTSSTPGG